MAILLTLLLCGVPTAPMARPTSPQDMGGIINPAPTLRDSAGTPSSTAGTKPPEQRPLTSIPSWLRPFVKYGVGGGVALWFVGSIFWMARQRFQQAKTPEQRAAAKQWLGRMLVGIVLAVGLLGTGVVTSIITRELLYIWIAAPVALLLPPLLLAYWGKQSSQR